MHKFKYFLPALVWAILIFSLSTSSAVTKIEFNLLSADKIGHLVFYAVQVVLLIWAFLKLRRLIYLPLGILSLCWSLSFVYGVSLELVQAMLPYRSFDYADMIANGVGALLGALIYRFCLKVSYC
jgi:VanZ family protein